MIAGFVIAILLTWFGWWFALGRKEPPQVPLALWFPVIPLTGVSGVSMILPSLIQFPLIATLFSFGIRRWSVRAVLAVLALGYVLAAGTAVAIVMSR
jgi:hypothetical protein